MSHSFIEGEVIYLMQQHLKSSCADEWKLINKMFFDLYLCLVKSQPISVILLHCLCLFKEWRPIETRKMFGIHVARVLTQLRGVLSEVKQKETQFKSL